MEYASTNGKCALISEDLITSYLLSTPYLMAQAASGCFSGGDNRSRVE
jgi:hypothetical protein